MNFSSDIKKSILSSTYKYIKKYKIPESEYEGRETAIIFRPLDKNFLTGSLENIRENGDWANRLKKRHTHFDAPEMGSSNSSDALLMNIFCHPKFFTWEGPQKYLGFAKERPEFGWNPQIEGETTPTEVDMLLGDTIYEAKLTESDFGSNPKDEDIGAFYKRYPKAKEIFDMSKLIKDNKDNKDNKDSKAIVKHYQLVRNIYAANEENKNFKLLLDARRPDLLKSLFEVVNSVKDSNLRYRCGFITWQEIYRTVGDELKCFLELKYGIC